MSSEKAQIVSTIRQVLSEKREILFAYIFGSFVDQENYRDIDIALYLEDPKKADVLQLEFLLAEELERKFPIPFDIRVINHAPPGFVYNLLTRKILVLDRDTDRRAAFESLALREYFDFRYLLKEYLEAVADAPLQS